MGFTFYKQLNAMDCGPTCLRMVAKHYGRHYNADTIRQISGYNKEGVTLLGISETAEQLGFRTRGLQIGFDKLFSIATPAILHWNQNHYIVLVSADQRRIKVADPELGIIQYSREEFVSHWAASRDSEGEPVGIVLLLEPTAAFYGSAGEKEERLNWIGFAGYLHNSRWQLFQIVVALLLGMLFQLVLPFLTKSMVDNGINTRNMGYITLVLVAQLVLTLSSSIVGFIRSRIQMRVSNLINISILSDFWLKLTRLPVSYFNAHHTGDVMQRIGDNRQVQIFLTEQTLASVLSLLSFVTYSIILIAFSPQIFLLFLLGNTLYFAWIRFFLRIRRKINYETFRLSAKENNATLQLVQGMQEIRLNNAEQRKRWEWENIQADIFQLNFRSLNFSQWQSSGALVISQVKDIFISFMVARLVVQGQLTFGSMLAVQYVLGALSGPISQFVLLIQNFQDAKISLERINEVHRMSDEEPVGASRISYLPADKSISFRNVSFSYPGAGNDAILKNIDLDIPEGKVTAIVGASGSGKTTLLRLLLKIFETYDGQIMVGDTSLRGIAAAFWRRQCGAVLQDGYIFDDSIAGNIAPGNRDVAGDRFIESCRLANILPFVESLPNGFNTQLGSEGVGISQGQKQRLLIARAIYKDPAYVLFDEATNALDAKNEKIITENLQEFFRGKTVVVVAHRLSTVKNADKIVVLENGKVMEEGIHSELIEKKGLYFELVRNQLQ